MNESFLRAYERELALLYERGKAFAQDHPGIAARLGGLLQGNLDPAVDGLMQGTAFMAARVQMQIEREFGTFTHELLEQLIPNFLAPTPSALLVQANPKFSDPELKKGRRFEPSAYMDARYVERERRIQCRYRLSAPLVLWPLELTEVKYLTGPGQIQALGLEVLPATAGGLVFNFSRPKSSVNAAEADPFSDTELDEFNVHFIGEFSDAIALYEAIFASTVRATLVFADERGDSVFYRLNPDQISTVGFDQDEALFAEDTRIFRGFTLIREFFLFPQKFLGFRLRGLSKILKRNSTPHFQLILETDTTSATLAPRINLDDFGLFCVPAINLFEELGSQIKVDPRTTEYPVVATSSPVQNYEVHRITDVFAMYPGSTDKHPVYPMYAAPPNVDRPSKAMYYSIRHRDRMPTDKERRSTAKKEYIGSETLLSFFEPAGLDDEDRVARLQVRTICSNRHLPRHLPIGQTGTDFFLNEDVTIELACVAGPTMPRDSIASSSPMAVRGEETVGRTPWRLISFLALNYLGLDNRSPDGGVAGLRELLSIFVDLSSPVNEQQIQGITKLETRPVVRSIKRANRFHSARGIEVRVTFDERAFEGTGIVLTSAILDRFFAEYAPVNAFTQTVAVSEQRGVLKTWPPRSGQGPLI